MDGMSWVLAAALFSQLSGTRIPPPSTQLPGAAPISEAGVVFPPHPGGTSQLTEAPNGNVLPSTATPATPMLTPPRQLPPTDATPLQPAVAVPAVTEPNRTPRETPPSSRAPIVATPPSGVLLTSGETNAGVVPIDRKQRPKADAAEILDAWLTLPEDLTVKGRPTPLVELLAPLSDRSRQVAVAQSYWQATAALLELRLAHDLVTRLSQFETALATQSQARGRATAALDGQVRLSAARARRTDAELQLTLAQHALAEQAGVFRDGPLPLPVDRPHAGSYRTLLDQLYGSSTAPLAARWFDRVAPLRHEAIRQQAAAVQSAHEAATAASEALHGGNVSTEVVWAAFDELTRAQQALIATVRDYNSEIAAYALHVPRGSLSPQELVGMLIRPLRGPVVDPTTTNPLVVRPNTLMRDDQVAPATFEQPRQEPTLAPPRATTLPGANANPPGTNNAPLAPPATSFGPRSAQRPVLDGPGESGLYRALVDQSPAKRAQELAGLLHWDHALPNDVGQPISLSDGLNSLPAERRAEMLDAYWFSREWIARHHVTSEKLAQLDALYGYVLGRNEATGTADATMRLETARWLAKAELLSVRAQLAKAQLRLHEVLGRTTSVTWYYGATAPHAGRYALQLEALPEGQALSEPVQRAAQAITALQRVLEERAGGVVLADAARVVETNWFAAGAPIAELPLLAIERQATESVRFLETLTRYNREIARYALAVMPQTVSPSVLVAALVTNDEANR